MENQTDILDCTDCAAQDNLDCTDCASAQDNLDRAGCARATGKLRELQLVELALFDVFAALCEKHGLRYYITGGTLLGAVRHGGFIPWDDDIDVAMPRPDYLRFVEIAQQELTGDIYFTSIYTNPNHIHDFSQICDRRTQVVNRSVSVDRVDDAWIDIFPFDGFPAGGMAARIQKLRLFYWRAMSRAALFDTAVNVERKRKFPDSLFVKILACPIFRGIKDYNRYFRSMDAALERYPYETSPMTLNYDGGTGFNEMFPNNTVEPGADYDFEGRIVRGPAQHAPTLCAIYGPDYMTPPPADARNWHCLEIV